MSPYSKTSLALHCLNPLAQCFLFGFDIGISSYVLYGIQNQHNSYVAIAESPTLQGVFVSTPSSGALLTSLALFAIADKMGRQLELRLGSYFLSLGSFLQLVSTFSNSSVLMLIGRLLFGIGVGFGLHGGPLYLGEIAPKRIRGLLVSSLEFIIVGGLLFGYILGDQSTSLLTAFSTYSIISLLSLCLAHRFLPESARWLVLFHGDRRDEALKSLAYLYPPEEAERQLVLLIETAEVEHAFLVTNMTFQMKLRLLFSPSSRHPLLVGVGLAVFQQITGQPSVLSYLASILQSLGLSRRFSLLIGLLKLVATGVSTLTIDSFGRKRLLNISVSTMALSLTFLAYGASAATDGNASVQKVLPDWSVLWMIMYILGYQVGLGPITMVINSEVYPKELRASGIATSAVFSFFSHAGIQFGLPILEAWVGLSWIFAIFAIFSGSCLLYTSWYIPETKGLSLEELESLFSSNSIGPVEFQSSHVESIPFVREDIPITSSGQVS